MRGEHLVLWRAKHPQTGSSPHARGARSGMGVLVGVAGLIPACAGSTDWFLVTGRVKGAHPRMRGEHTS